MLVLVLARESAAAATATANCCFSGSHETIKTSHILGHKIYLNRFKRKEIIQSLPQIHTRNKLETVDPDVYLTGTSTVPQIGRLRQEFYYEF